MIKISFINVADITYIYRSTPCVAPYQREGDIPDGSANFIDDVAKYYYKNILETLKVNQGVIKDYRYLGCFDRLANDIFEIALNHKKYKIAFTFDQFGNHNQLTVTLSYDESEEFDLQLERMKIAIKDEIIKNWEKSYWIRDDQSENLASSLYQKIHHVENLLRQLINDVMMKNIGVKWQVIPEMQKYIQKYNKNKPAFKKGVPEFSNIDDFLFSLDIDDLYCIMNLKIYSEIIERENFSNIKNLILNSTTPTLPIESIKYCFNVSHNLWEEYFKELFPENFNSTWKVFINSRNHVAHNKPLIYKSAKTFEANIDIVSGWISLAIEKYSRMIISNEIERTISSLEDQGLSIDSLI